MKDKEIFNYASELAKNSKSPNNFSSDIKYNSSVDIPTVYRNYYQFEKNDLKIEYRNAFLDFEEKKWEELSIFLDGNRVYTFFKNEDRDDFIESFNVESWINKLENMVL